VQLGVIYHDFSTFVSKLTKTTVTQRTTIYTHTHTHPIHDFYGDGSYDMDLWTEVVKNLVYIYIERERELGYGAMHSTDHPVLWIGSSF
jgi:hypothetical protein